MSRPSYRIFSSTSRLTITFGATGKDARYLNKLRRLLGKTGENDRKLVLHMAQKMARR